MPNQIFLRMVTAEEEVAIRRLAVSRKEPARPVQRAKVIVAMLDEPGLTACQAGLRSGYKSAGTGPMWVKRFNQEGIAGPDDRPRSRRRPTPPAGGAQCADQPGAAEAVFVGVSFRAMDAEAPAEDV